MTLLELLAAATGAGGVAADFGLLAADGLDFALGSLGAHGRLLIRGRESRAGGVGVSEREGPRSALGVRLAVAVRIRSAGRPDFEDDIRDAARNPPPHLGEQVAAFDGILALRMGLVAAEGSLHDRGLEVVHFEEMVLPGLVVDAKEYELLKASQLPS